MAVYATHTFTAVYFFREWKLEIYQFGAVASLSASHFLGALVWGMLADRTGRHKTVLIICVIGYATSYGLLNLRIFKSDNEWISKIIFTASMYALSTFFVAGFFPLIDAQVFAILSRDQKFTKELFGRQRLWGTIGHGAVTFLVGLLIEWLGFNGMFIVLGISCMLFLICIIFGIPSDIKVKKKSSYGHQQHQHQQNENSHEQSMEESRRHQTHKEIATLPVNNNNECDNEGGNNNTGSGSMTTTDPAWILLANPHFIFLMLFILSAGYVRAIMSLFLGFFMREELEQSFIIISCVNLCRMISEISVFFFSKQLLKMIGPHWMLILSEVAGISRCAAYAFLPFGKQWFYLSFAIELLKGASTGCILSSGLRLTNDHAPQYCQNTAQAFFSGCYSGLSAALGGALGGLIIWKMPGKSVADMFKVTSYGATIILIIFVLKYAFVDKVLFTRKIKH